MSESNGNAGGAVADSIRRIPLPKGWCFSAVGTLGEVRLGRQRSPKNRSDKYPTRYVRAANLTWAGIDLTDVLEMDFHPEQRATYALNEGDVLLSEASGSAGEVGKPVLWKDQAEIYCFQNTVIRFRPTGLLPRFAHRIFEHFARNGIFSKVAHGVGIHHLGGDRFSALPCLVPPLPEQHRIVEKIEELFSDLDAGVASLQRAKANLKRYRASVLKSAVEGRLTEDWRKEHPQAEDGAMLLDRILRERREKWERDQLLKFKEKGKEPPKNWQSKYKEPLEVDTTELSDLPQGWAWATAEQVCVQVTDGEHNQPRYQEAGMPMLTATHVRNGGVSFEKAGLIAEADYEKARARCAPMTGDVLIVCVGATTGRAGLVGEDHLFALVRSVLLLKPIVAGKYLLLWIDSPWTQAWIRTASGASAQAHFYISDAKRMPIPLPPLAEQEQIVALVEERHSQIDSAEKTMNQELIRSKRLRQSILKRAFEGNLVPQDPKDEPASVLLERIKASREAEQPKKKAKKVKAR